MRFKILLVVFVVVCETLGDKFPMNQTCGLKESSSEPLSFGPGTYGVAETKKSEWPWLVAFIYWPESKFFCAGSLISEKHVLSGK